MAGETEGGVATATRCNIGKGVTMRTAVGFGGRFICTVWGPHAYRRLWGVFGLFPGGGAVFEGAGRLYFSSELTCARVAAVFDPTLRNVIIVYIYRTGGNRCTIMSDGPPEARANVVYTVVIL